MRRDEMPPLIITLDGVEEGVKEEAPLRTSPLERFSIARIIAFVPLLLSPAPVYASRGADVATELQKRYEAIAAIEADFEEESYYKALEQRTFARGKVYLKKPSMMRWLVSEPEKEEMVSDGRTLWIYQPDLAQAVETSPAGGPSRMALSFLGGIADIKRDFFIEISAAKNSGWTLSLTPKAAGEEIKKLLLEVTGEFLATKVTVVDAVGVETTVGLKNIKINPSLEDSFFTFTPPKGVKIIKEAVNPLAR